MLFFKKKPNNNFDFSLPDGSVPNSRESTVLSLKSFAIKSGEDSVLHSVDSKYWVEASTQLEVSGFRPEINNESTPIAFANVSVRGVDEDSDSVKGKGILTTTFLTLHWKQKRESRGIKLLHSDLLGVDVSSPTSVYLHYGSSIRKTDFEFLNLGDITIEITLLPGKDKQENRLALTFWMSLAYWLSKTIPGVKFLELD